ncbi:hypothetical protein Tco_0256639 [Tanacetum coccineum]
MGNQESRRRDAGNTRYKAKEKKIMRRRPGKYENLKGFGSDTEGDFHEKKNGFNGFELSRTINKQKGKGTGQEENRPVWNNVQRLNHQNKFVPKAVLTKTGRFPVNTARPIVNDIGPRNNFYKSHSPIRRPFNKTTAPKANFTNHKVNTAGDKTVSAVGGNRETAVKALTCCNWRSKRHYWNKVSKYNSGSNSSKNVHVKVSNGLGP